jgi:multidrug resistance efflux pump
MGDVLAILDASELDSQFQEAGAARDVAQAQLEQVLAGASQEEIKFYETAAENAQIVLDNSLVAEENAQQSLSDVEAVAEENLNQAYEDAQSTLNDVYTKAYNASNVVISIFRDYFETSILIKEDKENIEEIILQMEASLANIRANPVPENIEQELQDYEQYLLDINQNLEHIRTTIEKPEYFWQVPATEKSSLDSQISYLNSAVSNVITARQAIFSTELTSQTSINTARAEFEAAQSAVKLAEGELKAAQDKLDQIKAPAPWENINLAESQLEQAEAALTGVKQKLTKTKLVASCEGTVTDLKKQEGELVMSMIKDPVVTLMCKEKFQLEIDIPEIDIAKIDTGDSAEILLDALPGQIFSGKVANIDPAETVIQGVVYYKVIIIPQETKEKIKSGMTANVEIVTEVKKDVIAVPWRSVLTKEGKKYIRIIEEEQIKEVEVETGIKGTLGEIEIISGIKEGDRVITFIKE